ncbi:TPA: glucosyltransferase domain-containing protein [Proteus mirabilis]
MNARKQIILYFIILLLISFPILLANTYYVDDMGRAAIGYTNWGIDGRPFSDLLMILLNFNTHIVDLYPLPLFIGLLFISVSLFIIHRKLINKTDPFSVLLPLTYIISPALSEVLSYRFDSLPMLASIAAPTLILLVNSSKAYIRIFLYTIIICITYSTYQASINLLILISICEFINRFNKKNKPLVFLFEIFISFIIGAIFYLKIILPTFFGGNHGGNHPMLANGDFISSFLLNINKYYSFLNKNVFGEHAYLFFITYVVVMLLCMLFLVKRSFNKNINFLISTLVMLIIPFISIFFCVGALLFLKSSIPYFTRIYVGFGGVIFLLFYSLSLLEIKLVSIVSLIASAIISMYTVVYLYAYGNALSVQDKYTTSIINEIKFLSVNWEYSNIAFTGKQMKPNMLINSEKNFPLLKYSVPQYFNNFYWPYRRILMENLSLRRPANANNVSSYAIKNMCNADDYIRGKNFNLYLVGETIVVDSDKKCK